jgi:hypothetical protein
MDPQHKPATSAPPDGTPRAIGASMRLPPAGTTRWVPRRKAAVVAAVRAGAISLSEACTRYTLSVDEFLSWHRAFEDDGMSGLRATKRRPAARAK